MSRPPKGTLPALHPKWVIVERGETLRVACAASSPTPRNRLKAMTQYVAVYPTTGAWVSYETTEHCEIERLDASERFLLFNRGGWDARHHWSIVDKVGLFGGYYVLCEIGPEGGLTVVEHPV